MRHASSLTVCKGGLTWLELLAFCLFSRPTRCDDQPQRVLDDSLKFFTRPDIEAPRFDVKVYDQALVSPGYWFIESYDYLDQSRANGGHWTAPHIYDGSGGLIWSGSYLSQQYNSFDFRISNVLGEQMMTWLYPKNRTAIVMDTYYNIRDIFQLSDLDTQFDNMHDLNFVDNGSRVLYFYDETRELTASQSIDVGFQGVCRIRENSFRERDMATEDIIFSWSASDHVDLKESTYTKKMEERCTEITKAEKGWDFIHANSLDKFPDGSGYLMSARHTNSIYKIGVNGSIIWHLGGRNNDFESDFSFARQHHARIQEHNSTHTTLSLFDNAMAEDTDTPAAPYSRGILVTLQHDVSPMKAMVIAEYPHPDREYTLGRASTQVLPNGNVFMCWVNSCLMSEHTADGSIVMEARVKQKWLKTYRAYKFQFVGLPHRPPDVCSEASSEAGETKTTVYTSWNGATEVETWRLYKTDSTGHHKTHLASLRRESFESTFVHQGYAKYVMVEAFDDSNTSLGRSDVLETTVSSALPDDVLADEQRWLQGHEEADESLLGEGNLFTRRSTLVVAFGITVVLFTVFKGRILWRAGPSSMLWWKRGRHS